MSGGWGDNAPAISADGASASEGTIVFSNSPTVTFGMAGSTITASASGGGGGITAINVSAGTTSNNLSAITFSNSNGLAFGIAASVVTGSYTVPTVTNSSWTLSDTATSVTISRLAFTNSNGLTLTLSTGAGAATVIGSYTVPTVTNSSWTASDSATSVTISRLAFTNSNGITLTLSTGAGAATVVGSHNGLTSQSNQAFSVANGSSAFQTLSINDSNSVSWTNAGGALGVASIKLQMYAVSNTTQNTSGTANHTAISFGGAGIASVGVTGGSVVISVPSGGGAATHASYFNPPPDIAINTQTFSFAQSTSYIAPFVLQQNYSFDRIRIVASGSVAASSTQATTGNVSHSMSGITSHNIVIYTRNVGASSLSLKSHTSTQVVDQCLMTRSFAAGNSSQYSVSLRYTLGTLSVTKDYSSSVTRQDWHTSHLTDLTGARYIDIPLGISLSPGQYWLGYGRSTTSDTQNASISVATRLLVSHNSMVAISQNTLAIGMVGGNTNSSVGWWPGHGSFTTGGAAGTTASLNLSAISTTASNNALYFQLMRIA